MLSVLRKNAGSWLIKVVLGAIVVVFMFFGVDSVRESQRSRAAVVNGETITVNEHKQASRRLLEQFRQQFGNSLNDELLKSLEIERKALDQLIDQRLLLGEAERLSVRVTDSELSDAIMEVAAFQFGGIFNTRTYHGALSRNRLTPEEFETSQRNAMLINKLRSYITSSAKVSTGEARQFYQWKKASVNVDFVLFSPSRYKEIAPTVDEIADYYESHKTSYSTEPMVKVRYVDFESNAYAPKAKITDEDINAYYEDNPAASKIAKTVEARHILLKVPPNATPEIVEKKREEALTILKMARKGEDFSALARKHSEGPTQKKGGKLGAFKRESMEKPFSDMAFSMEAGDISEPVRTRFGWHIINVEKVNEASARSLADMEGEIRKTLSAERGKNLAYDEAQAVYDRSFEGDDMVKAAEARGLPVFESDLFTMRDPDKGLKDPSKFATAAFGLSKMDISDILDYGQGYTILQVLEKRPEEISALKDVADSVRGDLKGEQQDEKARKEAEAFLSNLKGGDRSIVDESDSIGLTLESTGFFTRNDSVPKIGYEREIIQAAFALSDNTKVPETVIKGRRGYYVISFKERKEPSAEGFDKEKKKITADLLAQKRFTSFNTMLSALRAKSTIDIALSSLQ